MDGASVRPLNGSHAASLQRAYFDGLRAPQGKIIMLQGSNTYFSGLQGLHLLKFEKTTMGIVWAPGLQAFKMMGSRAPAIFLRRLYEKFLEVKFPSRVKEVSIRKSLI